MPEGPEIHLAARRIDQAIAGQEAREVFFAFERLKPYERKLTGCRVERVRARGKAILTSFSGGLVVYSHNQLFGIWHVKAAGEMPDTRRQLRFAVHTARTSALLFSASDIEILTPPEVEAHPYIARLGPDAVESRTSSEAIYAQLEAKAFRRRRLTSLLLDQAFVAGLGNYLRSEILFVCGLHPDLRPVDLSEDAKARLSQAILELPRRSFATRGITNDPSRVAGLKARGEPYDSYRFFLFGRDGKPCYDCGAEVERHELGGRRLYLCPNCQPRP